MIKFQLYIHLCVGYLFRPGSFDSVVPVSSDPGDEGRGGDKNKNDVNLKIGFNHHN